MTPDGCITSSGLLRKAICYNQGAYIQYYYRGHALHTLLKNALYVPQATDAVCQHKSTLDNFLDSQLQKVVETNFSILDSLYVHRKKGAPAPSIRMKANFLVDDKTVVFDLFRHRAEIEQTFSLNDPSGYNHVATSGSHFIANNKALLIIPITLYNNNLDAEFKNIIEERYANFQQVIFAYLCFEHGMANYFDEDADVDIGYMFADLISLYFFTRWNLTLLSQTYCTAIRRLNQQDTR